jgi:hypothetical protein
MKKTGMELILPVIFFCIFFTVLVIYASVTTPPKGIKKSGNSGITTEELNNNYVLGAELNADAKSQYQTVEMILASFSDWDNLGFTTDPMLENKNKNLLSIIQNSHNKKYISSIELYIFNKKPASIKEQETETFDRLLKTVLPNWNESKEWLNNSLKALTESTEDKPVETTEKDNWKLSIRYTPKEGVILKTVQRIPFDFLEENKTTEERREEFETAIKIALNITTPYKICSDVYFNHKGELIIVVNSEWYYLSEGEKKDMIYAIEKSLKNKKGKLGVEGFGQFFSTAGRPLESFYAY